MGVCPGKHCKSSPIIVITGPDGFAIFEVSDGSTFEVYPNSRVTFRANASNWKDFLDVWLGRVKVHIEKIGGMPNNNKVRTPTAVISVRGTTFDVAIEDEDSTLVSVDEGIVDVEHALLPTKEPKRLMQGDSIRVYKDQPLARATVNKDLLVQHTLRAVQEALYRIVFRSPSSTGGVRAAPADSRCPVTKAVARHPAAVAERARPHLRRHQLPRLHLPRLREHDYVRPCELAV